MSDISEMPAHGSWKAMSGECFDAPAFHRNHAAITDVLRRLLGDRTGNVIEIGSGTGQHVITFAAALPNLTWWPSDPDPAHRASIDAWRAVHGPTNVKPSVDLDAAAPDWELGQEGRPPGQEIDAILCVNVLHIAPWSVSLGLILAASRYLQANGALIVYGPVKQNGVHEAPSNATFDAHLRQQNDQWGVRDSADLNAAAIENGLKLVEMIDMPANNTTLVFGRA